MYAHLEKDDSLRELLARLRQRLGPDAFDIVDYWEGDRVAIGIARPDNHDVLAYLSTLGWPGSGYSASLELPGSSGESQWANHPYVPAGDFDQLDFEALVKVIQHHFSWGE